GSGDGTSGPRQWRAEFPYHWDADDLVSRRELLQLAVYASGALFAAAALLAPLAWPRGGQPTAVRGIARAREVPQGEARYFHYPEMEEDAVLLHLRDGRFVCYSQKCTHLSCAVYYQPDRGRLYCPCHDGVYDAETGEPIAGPPQRRLPRIQLHQEGEI